MIIDSGVDCYCSDDEIRWYVKSRPIIYPRHLVRLNNVIRLDASDIAEVDTTVRGWPVVRRKEGVCVQLDRVGSI